MDPMSATLAFSVPELVSIVFPPLFGYIYDKYGLNGYAVIASALFVVPAHALFAFTNATPFVGMTLLGLSRSLFTTAYWPCVASVVAEHQIAVIFDIIQ